MFSLVHQNWIDIIIFHLTIQGKLSNIIALKKYYVLQIKGNENKKSYL